MLDNLKRLCYTTSNRLCPDLRCSRIKLRHYHGTTGTKDYFIVFLKKHYVLSGAPGSLALSSQVFILGYLLLNIFTGSLPKTSV